MFKLRLKSLTDALKRPDAFNINRLASLAACWTCFLNEWVQPQQPPSASVLLSLATLLELLKGWEKTSFAIRSPAPQGSAPVTGSPLRDNNPVNPLNLRSFLEEGKFPLVESYLLHAISCLPEEEKSIFFEHFAQMKLRERRDEEALYWSMEALKCAYKANNEPALQRAVLQRHVAECTVQLEGLFNHLRSREAEPGHLDRMQQLLGFFVISIKKITTWMPEQGRLFYQRHALSLQTVLNIFCTQGAGILVKRYDPGDIRFRADAELEPGYAAHQLSEQTTPWQLLDTVFSALRAYFALSQQQHRDAINDKTLSQERAQEALEDKTFAQNCINALEGMPFFLKYLRCQAWTCEGFDPAAYLPQEGATYWAYVLDGQRLWVLNHLDATHIVHRLSSEQKAHLLAVFDFPIYPHVKQLTLPQWRELNTWTGTVSDLNALLGYYEIVQLNASLAVDLNAPSGVELSSLPVDENDTGSVWPEREVLKSLRTKLYQRAAAASTDQIASAIRDYSQAVCQALSHQLETMLTHLPGEAPCPFALCLKGSLAQSSAHAYSDLDPFLLVAEESCRAHPYFQLLLQRWHQALIFWGDDWTRAEDGALHECQGLGLDAGDWVHLFISKKFPMPSFIQTPTGLAALVQAALATCTAGFQNESISALALLQSQCLFGEKTLWQDYQRRLQRQVPYQQIGLTYSQRELPLQYRALIKQGKTLKDSIKFITLALMAAFYHHRGNATFPPFSEEVWCDALEGHWPRPFTQKLVQGLIILHRWRLEAQGQSSAYLPLLSRLSKDRQNLFRYFKNHVLAPLVHAGPPSELNERVHPAEKWVEKQLVRLSLPVSIEKQGPPLEERLWAFLDYWQEHDPAWVGSVALLRSNYSGQWLERLGTQGSWASVVRCSKVIINIPPEAAVFQASAARMAQNKAMLFEASEARPPELINALFWGCYWWLLERGELPIQQVVSLNEIESNDAVPHFIIQAVEETFVTRGRTHPEEEATCLLLVGALRYIQVYESHPSQKSSSLLLILQKVLLPALYDALSSGQPFFIQLARQLVPLDTLMFLPEEQMVEKVGAILTLLHTLVGYSFLPYAALYHAFPEVEKAAKDDDGKRSPYQYRQVWLVWHKLLYNKKELAPLIPFLETLHYEADEVGFRAFEKVKAEQLHEQLSLLPRFGESSSPAATASSLQVTCWTSQGKVLSLSSQAIMSLIEPKSGHLKHSSMLPRPSSSAYAYRRVTRLTDEKALDIYLKEHPDFPMMAYAVDLLGQRICGHGTTPSELVVFQVVGKKTGQRHCTYPVLVSLTVPGKTLETVFREEAYAQYPLDPQALSDMFMLELLKHPGDGFARNYVVIPYGNTKRYRL
ncbi:MAG: hypothetical protein K2Q14_00615, partial [Gammaproteobacteria bacterium]|nr:hypothetical protein [Gammaproteobacteria bacterium]